MPSSLGSGTFAELIDGALAMHDARGYARFVLRQLERWLPHDTALLFTTYASGYEAGRISDPCYYDANGWNAEALRSAHAGMVSQIYDRVHGREFGRVFRAAIETRSYLRSKGLASGLMYQEMIERHRLSACWSRSYSSPFGATSIVVGRASTSTRVQLELGGILDALTPVIHAGFVLTRAPTLSATKEERISTWASCAGISKREATITEYVLRGFTNRQIATALGTSALTVRNQVASIFRKANVASRTELSFTILAEPPSEFSHADIRSRPRSR